MAGIYIHIPFCRSRCIYCGFYSTTSLELRQLYVDSLCREVEMRGMFREGGPTKTIYLGGGTPSLLTQPQLHLLFEAIYKYNKVAEDAEVTIEVNPDDVTAELAEGLRLLPVNRVSMGVQTFDEARLRFLHRRHTAAQATAAIERLRDAGIRNISIDLMYGFPGETLDDWERDIDAALRLGAEHLSAYCLTVEEGTPLHRMHTKPLDEETERAMYYHLIDRLEASGYEHYEISNFAKIIPTPSPTGAAQNIQNPSPTGADRGGHSFRSRHNSSYWNATPYVGIGASAHSYEGRTRSWNVADLCQYIEGMKRGERIFDFETLDDDTRYDDLVATALRTREGLDLTMLTEKHRDYCIRTARRFVSDGLLRISETHMALTRRGLFISDMIMSELMYV